jgi:hypothetical protein
MLGATPSGSDFILCRLPSEDHVHVRFRQELVREDSGGLT